MRRIGLSGAAAAAMMFAAAGTLPIQAPQGEGARAERESARKGAGDLERQKAPQTRSEQLAASYAAWLRCTRRRYPRRTPDWTNARYRRAAAKKRNVARNRRAHRG